MGLIYLNMCSELPKNLEICTKIALVIELPYTIMNKFILTFIIFLSFMLGSFFPVEIHDSSVRVVVIDAGHGGKDPGCRGKNNTESKVALATALELGRIIKENMSDVKVIYTRQTDVFIELHERTRIANKNGADLFISIHCNSGPAAASDTETFSMGLHKMQGSLNVTKKENSVIFQEKNNVENYKDFDPNSIEQYILMAQFAGANQAQSNSLADKIQKDFSKRVGRVDRGVKQAGLYVLWKTTMPSVLVEIGFLTNPTEEKYLAEKKNRVYIASGIYRAFKSYKNDMEALKD